MVGDALEVFYVRRAEQLADSPLPFVVPPRPTAAGSLSDRTVQ
jgi:hypothetical protein